MSSYNASSSKSNSYQKKLQISLASYKRIQKDINYYHNELIEHKKKWDENPTKHTNELFSEIEETIVHTEKQKIMFLNKLKTLFYIIKDLNNEELNNLEEYKEAETIINNETYA